MNMRVIMAALVTAMGFAALAGGRLCIVDGGISRYAIVVPDGKDDAAKVQEAAEALQTYIKRSTGARLAIVSEGKSGGAPAFYLGRTKRGAAAGVPYAKLVDYVTYRKAAGDDIILAGNDESAGISGPLGHHDREYLCQKYGLNADVKDMSYRRWHGTLRAVLDFLDDVRAVEFLMPGENGLNIVPQMRLTAGDRELPGLGAWTFQYSNGRCYGDVVTSTALGHTQIPHYMTWGGHTMPVAVPRSKYEKTHPEYFIMKDGVRRPDYGPAHGGHHCVSNPEVLDLVVAELKRQYNRGYRWIQFGPTDGQVPCECDACAKMHPDPRERQWIFSRAVAERAREVIPDAKIVILAYVFTRWAPKTFDTFPDNVILELTLYRQGEDLLNDWKKFPDVPKLAYTYFFGDYHSWAFAPTCSPKYLEKHFRLMKESNIMGVFKCGMIQDPGLEAPIAYVFSQLLRDPSQDADALADEFCEKAYGCGAEPMKRFLRLMYSDLVTPMGHSVIDEMRKTPHAPAQMFNYAFRPAILKSMGRLLAQAEAAAKGEPKARARLALVRRSYDFLLLRSKCYNVQDAWTLSGSKDVLAVADRLFDEREKMLDSWYDSNGRMKPLDGFDWPYLGNHPREVVVRGGGQIVPCFPDLFRYGKGSVKELLGKGSFSLLSREFWEGYGEFGRRMLLGDGLDDLKREAESAETRVNCDMNGVLKSLLSFREKYRDFLVDGTIVGELKPLDAAENVFGVFRRNRSGETALFVCATSERKQTIRFRFPGADNVETRELGLCTLHVFREKA